MIPRFAILVLVMILLWFMGRSKSESRQLKRQEILGLVLILFFTAFATNIFHEFGHWLAGTLLGNEMSMSLNGTWPTNGNYLKESHSLYVALGGPGFTILQAIIALVIIEKYRTLYAYPFLFYPFFSRFFSVTFGKFANQDEAGISVALGLGNYSVAVIVCSILLTLAWRGSRTLKLNFMAVSVVFLGSLAGKLMVICTCRMFFS